MLNWTRFLTLVAVALFATQPVMACCLTGHEEVSETDVAAKAPPCHSSAPKAQQPPSGEDFPAQQKAIDCPGCLDCDSAMMQAQSVDTALLFASALTPVPFAILEARFDGFEHKRMVRKTGPPDAPPLPHNTPISLKQRLLV